MQVSEQASDIPSPHYLANELNELAQADTVLWGFIQRASLDGVWYWDLENPENLYISPEYWQCLGIDPATRRHSPDEFVDVVFPEDLPNIMTNLEQHYANPDVPYEQIVRFRHAHGSTVWVRCSGLAIRDTQGRAIRMLGAHNDITKIKEAESAAVTQAQLLEQAYEELKQLTYRISHDLTAPINTIELLLTEIRSDDANRLSEDQQSLCKMVLKTTTRARQTLKELLTYSQAIHGPKTWSIVNLRHVTEQAIENLTCAIKEANAQIVIGTMDHTNGDPHQLMSLIQNLISNSIKYRSPMQPPHVEVFCQGHASDTVLTVRDNSMGMKAELMERIFQPFERLHSQDEIHGTGLGLAVCDRIVKNHRGSIKVTSQPNEGSTFQITLPRVNAQ